MVKLLVLYGHPEDPEAFDRHYRDTHTPLALAMPELVGFSVDRPLGADTPYHLIAELVYPDADALARSLASPAGEAAADDVANFATGSVAMVTVDCEAIR